MFPYDIINKISNYSGLKNGNKYKSFRGAGSSLFYSISMPK